LNWYSHITTVIIIIIVTVVVISITSVFSIQGMQLSCEMVAYIVANVGLAHIEYDVKVRTWVAVSQLHHMLL